MTAPFCTDCGTGCTSLYGRDADPSERDIAEERIAGFIASHLGLNPNDGAIDRLGIEQCRAAWKALARASYDDVALWARRYRGVKGRVAA